MKRARIKIKRHRILIAMNQMKCLCVLLFLSCFYTSITLTSAQSQSAEILSSNQAWRDFNYYQLLGLLPEDYYTNNKSSRKKKSPDQWGVKSRRERQKERKHIQSKDIKKAYRKQAQAWHPDKIALRKSQQVKANATNSNGIDYSNLSEEECNARFAKIAEAYEVLNDDDKRLDYDAFLLDAEDEKERDKKRQQQNHNKGGKSNRESSSSAPSSSFFQDFFTDPMATFEEFFFGNGDGNGRNFMEDIFDSFYGGSEQQSDKYSNRQPDRTSETTQVRYDPRYGTEVLKVLQKEEFYEPQKKRIYFRVTAQEFIEEFDFYGRSMGYTPISQPEIVQEGHTPMKEQRRGRKKKNSDSSSQKRRQQRQKRRQMLNLTSHRLEKYQYITPQSIHLHSSNGEYYAGLTLECELVIMHDKGPFEEDTQVWGSNTYAPPQHRDRCALAMYGARIAIVIGNVENPGTILWASPPPPPIVPGNTIDEEEVIDFYCSLDDDGSLTVYRTREIEKISVIGREFLDTAEKWWSDLVAGEPSTPPMTRAGENWKAFQRWAKLKTTGKPTVGRSERKARQNENERVIDECVYATSPAGCYAAGRQVINISKTIKRSVEKVVSQLDDRVGGIMDSLHEGSEDDIDLLDTFVRIVSTGFRSVTTSGLRAFKRFLPKFMDIISEGRYKFSKYSRILRYESRDYLENSKHKIKNLRRVIRKKIDQMMNQFQSREYYLEKSRHKLRDLRNVLQKKLDQMMSQFEF